jgi:hypothetical protein
MTEVAGSKQYRSVVVQHRPGRRALLLVALSALLIASCGLCYWLGGVLVETKYQGLAGENATLSQQLISTSGNLAEVSQQLANISTGAEIDRQAVNEVRTVISEHKQTINALNEEINFYKGLMAPTERERGLGIRSWELYPGSAPGRFQFKLILQQLALKHSMLKGDVVVDIVGKRAGVEQTLSLASLSEQIKGKAIKLRFKYFQYVDGELQLPGDFVAERIDIRATATTPKKVQVEKRVSWLVQ